MKLTMRILFGAAVLPIAACHRTATPPVAPTQPPPLPAFVVDRVPSDAIVGLVVDDEANALRDAIVRLDNTTVARTDSTGRFEIDHVIPGPHVVRALRFGSHKVSRNVHTSSGAGVAVVMQLRAETIHLTDVCIGGGQDAIVARLLPVRLLVAPGTPAMTYPHNAHVYIRFGGQVDTIAPDSTARDTAGRLIARGGMDRPGRYRVEVAAPGFVTWKSGDITVEPTHCGLIPKIIDVQLKRPGDRE